MFVMGGAVGVNIVTFNMILRGGGKPVFREKFNVPTRRDINAELVCGAAMFGIGWGLGGICPAPGLVNLATGRQAFFVWTACLCAGMYLRKVTNTPKVHSK